jgi:hypothetical protein
MASAYTHTIKTIEGKYVGQVRQGTATHYETPEYLTKAMAISDANCWKAFHMTEETAQVFDPKECSIDVSDVVTSNKTNGGIPTRQWTGPEFAEFLKKNMNKFPTMSYRVSQEYDGRVLKGQDFYLILKKTPESRDAVFRVHKYED